MKRKHFLLIGSAMLCLVLLLSACGLKSAAPSPTPGAVINVTDLGGVYAEDVAHRGSLTLTPLNATAAKIVIDWPFSANQSGHWEMTGSYDAGTGALIYNDGVLTEQTYDAQGNPVDNMVYSGGSGRFAVSGSKLTWTDNNASAGVDPSVFTYAAPLDGAQQPTEPGVTPTGTGTQTPGTSPAPAATPTPAPTPTPVPTPTPTPNEADLPVIRKSPTDETVGVGGSCYFYADYKNALWAVWHFVSPDGTEDVSYEEANAHFPTLQVVNGMYSQMQLKNIPQELSGWKFYCRYSNRAGYRDTEMATLTVSQDAQNLPIIKKSPTSEKVAEGGSCYFLAKYENAIWAVWHFVSPDGTEDLTYDEAAKRFSGLQVLNGEYSQMQLTNIPLELNGWKVYCAYRNRTGTTNTEMATITVEARTASNSTAPVQTPAPTPVPTPVPTPAATLAPVQTTEPVGDPASVVTNG